METVKKNTMETYKNETLHYEQMQLNLSCAYQASTLREQYIKEREQQFKEREQQFKEREKQFKEREQHIKVKDQYIKELEESLQYYKGKCQCLEKDLLEMAKNEDT
jgi:uncharacterized protein (DUF3084 family)